MTLQETLLKYHRHLSAIQWNSLLKLDKLTNLISDNRYHMGEGLDHGNMNLSEDEFNDLREIEGENNLLLSTIIGYFESNEIERLDEVHDLIEVEVNEAIKKSEEILNSVLA